jgi:hypothetical protein
MNKKIPLYMSIAIALGLSAAAPPAAVFAGPTGVFLSDDTYFTLQNATFASGTDDASLQFSLNLHNGGSDEVDFNHYGATVVDADGNTFSAKLTSKQSARVLPGQDKQFRFYSSVAPDETADQLQVSVFAWDDGSTSTTSLGNLPVIEAINGEQDAARQAVLRLSDIDATYPGDAVVTFQVAGNYRVAENGKSYIYSELYATNGGSASLTLPSALQFKLVDGQSLSYNAAVTGGNPTLLPNQPVKLALKTEVPSDFALDQSTLQWVTKVDASENVVAGVALSGSDGALELGAEQPFAAAGSSSTLVVRADSASAVSQSDGVHVQTTVVVRNDGDQSAGVPVIKGAYQFGSSGSRTAGSDQSATQAYLAPSETVSLHFAALLPPNTDPGASSLVLMANGNEAQTSASGTSGSSASSSGTATGSAGRTGTTASSTSGSSGSGSSGSSGSGSGSGSTGSGDAYSPFARISLSGVLVQTNPLLSARDYVFGAPLILSPNGLIDKSMDVALEELHMHANSDFGYNTAIAKFKLTNNGNTLLAAPNFGVDLVNSSGITYQGVRQTTVAEQILPNTSYVVTYSFFLPAGETGENLAMNLVDGTTLAPNKLTIGSYKTAVQPEADPGERISFYPFELKFNNYSLMGLFNGGSFSYKLSLDMTVDMQEQAIVDSGFSTLEFDLVDKLGRVIGTQSMSFTGANKLVTGSQSIIFSSVKTEALENGLTINAYETIDTPSGPAKRLIQVFHP